MRRIAIAIAVAILAYIIIGLVAVSLPHESVPVEIVGAASAASPKDPACQRALKRVGVPKQKRVKRCRIRTRSLPSASASTNDYHERWRVGNAAWLFDIEVSARWVTAPNAIGYWRPLSTVCWKRYAHIVSLDIKRCDDWRSGPYIQMGAIYETAFGPVSFGNRSYVVLHPDARISGPHDD